jgi:hypothetical protein
VSKFIEIFIIKIINYTGTVITLRIEPAKYDFLTPAYIQVLHQQRIKGTIKFYWKKFLYLAQKNRCSLPVKPGKGEGVVGSVAQAGRCFWGSSDSLPLQTDCFAVQGFIFNIKWG